MNIKRLKIIIIYNQLTKVEPVNQDDSDNSDVGSEYEQGWTSSDPDVDLRNVSTDEFPMDVKNVESGNVSPSSKTINQHKKVENYNHYKL